MDVIGLYEIRIVGKAGTPTDGEWNYKLISRRKGVTKTIRITLPFKLPLDGVGELSIDSVSVMGPTQQWPTDE